MPGAPGAYGAEDPDDPAYQRAKAARLPYEGTWEPEPYLRTVPKLFDYLRRKVGWDVQLFHDAHGRLTPTEAARLLRELEPYKLLYLEDPIGPEHAPSMRRVREAGTTPIAIGEIVSSRYEILPMIVEQTIDYMRCSPIHIGGITEAKKLAAIGEPYEVRTAYHGPGDVSPIGAAASAHVGMAIPNFGIQEWVRHPDAVHEVLTGGPWLEDGYLRLARRARAGGGHRRGAGRQVSAPAQVPAGAPSRGRQHARILRRTTWHTRTPVSDDRTQWALALTASGVLWLGVATPREAQAQGSLPKAVGTFTYWGGLIFSEEANNMLVQRIRQWGKEKGIPVDVVMINQNETIQRVSAAVEAGTMPDALDMGRDLMLLLSQNSQLEPLDDVYDRIGQDHGGWLKSADSATDPKDFGGKRYGIPFGTSGNLLNRARMTS